MYCFILKSQIKNQKIRIKRNRQIYTEAEDWWSEIKEFVFRFNSNNTTYSLIAFYDIIFFEILKDFDIKNRIEQLNSCSERKKDLNIIPKEIEEKIYMGYDSLHDELKYKLIHEPFPHISLTVESIKKYTDACFQQNLSLAWYFQKQQSFQELADLNTDIQNQQDKPEHLYTKKHTVSTKHDNFKYDWDFHVRSLQELLFYLQYCENQIQMEDKKKPIWFRGQSDESFKLVPAVMRKYDQDMSKQHISLRAYQQYEFEKFKGYADGVPEVPNGVRITLSDYIALMQHYFIPTNLLDWSENAFSALYFALENYFEQNGEKKGNVALYLLSPG